MRVWAEIDLNAIHNNYNKIKANFPKVMCVIKADAYGHGSVRVAQKLENADYFGVATLEECLELRENNVQNPILLLGFFENAEKIIDANITATIFNLDTAKNLSKTAYLLNKTAKIHIKVDTGMNRLGFTDINEILKVCNLPNLEIEGIFTHLASHKTAKSQCKKFDEMYEKISQQGIKIPIKHIANSDAISFCKNISYDMVRTGISLFGYPNDFIPAMTLKARIASIKICKKGSKVSYEGTETLKKDTKIAVITIGYADGFPRSGSCRAKVLVNGRLCKIIGTICMDMSMIEICDDAKIGDEVIIFGKELPADILAKSCKTISYEILCAVSKRVPRIYK